MVYFNGKQYLQVTTLKMTPQLRTLLTIIRDKETKRNDFIFYADRINRLLVEEGLNFLPIREKTVETGTGEKDPARPPSPINVMAGFVLASILPQLVPWLVGGTLA